MGTDSVFEASNGGVGGTLTSRFFPCDLCRPRPSSGFEGVHRSGAGVGAGATVPTKPLLGWGWGPSKDLRRPPAVERRDTRGLGLCQWGSPQK